MENIILLIDDSPVDRKIIRTTLKKRLDNVTIYEMDNGFDVNEKIRELDVSMCIVDVMMSEKDGFEVLAEIKEDQSVKDIPVIICTGIRGNNGIEKALKLGAYDYFSKPLTEEAFKISLPLKVKNAIELKKRNDEIKQLSYYDVLTGAYSRRFYEEEIKRLDAPRNLPITIVTGDVNGLKLVNDTFGHTIGDEVLVKVVEVIKKNCRNDDIIARWGGDEFVILLPKTECAEAEKIIHRIQDEFSGEDVRNLNISISFGLATKTNEEDSLNAILNKSEDFMYKNKMMVKESARSQMIAAMTKTLNEKNPREEKHSRRVSKICMSVGLDMNLSESEVNRLKLGGLLHDIGKIALEEDILNKPGKLDDIEWERIQRHPSIGYRILSELEEMRDIAELALSHHEHWNGNGYPRGLSGEKIPLLARIVAVADTFDALTSERTYRKVLSDEEAIIEIEKCSGTQFDPQVVNIFVSSFSFNT